MVDLTISVIEEPLQLLGRQRPPAGTALVLTRVRRGVPLMADHPRSPPELLLALLHPPVPSITHELDEQTQDVVIPADRRVRDATRPQRRREPSTSSARQSHGYSFVKSANR
jgi:hypothetical protein